MEEKKCDLVSKILLCEASSRKSWSHRTTYGIAFLAFVSLDNHKTLFLWSEQVQGLVRDVNVIHIMMIFRNKKNIRIMTVVQCNPVILALKSLRQQDHYEFEASLGYIESSRPPKLHKHILSQHYPTSFKK